MSASTIDVLIPSRDRPARLRRLLASLAVQRAEVGRVIVLANGLDRRMQRPYERLVGDHPGVELVVLPAPGKARALNAGIARCQAEWIAFLDDDVVVLPGWARAFLSSTAAGGTCFQGRIRFAQRVYEDRAAMALYDKYRMLPQVDPPRDGIERRAMVGANCMAARRALLEVGGFNERLGPGASGLDEDTEISRRLRSRGHTIRYVQTAAVEHDFRASRMTAQAMDAYCASLGRGRAIMRPGRSHASILWQALVWGGREAFAALVGWERQRLRSRCKRLIYQEMFASVRASTTLIPERAGAPQLRLVEPLRPDDSAHAPASMARRAAATLAEP